MLFLSKKHMIKCLNGLAALELPDFLNISLVHVPSLTFLQFSSVVHELNHCSAFPLQCFIEITRTFNSAFAKVITNWLNTWWFLRSSKIYEEGFLPNFWFPTATILKLCMQIDYYWMRALQPRGY